jgi:cell cycle checkpoint protein
VVDSDDDDYESPPPARSASTSTRRDVAAAAPTRAPATRRSTVAASKPKPKLAAAPKKPTAKSKLTGQYAALHQFFGVPQGGVFPVPSASQTTPTASQNEDADDLIEDSDDGGVVAPLAARRAPQRKKDGTLTPHLVVSKPGAAKCFTSLPAVKAPHTTSVPTSTETSTTATAATVAGKQEGMMTATASIVRTLTRPSDTRTWPEKYEPKSVDELALNKAKVKEVRACLEGMLDGTSRQRVLVLKGSAGTGKTATVNALAKEIGVEILEWRNPANFTVGEEYGEEEGAFAAGLSGLFEEFISRAGTFGSLDMVPATGKMPVLTSSQSQSVGADGKKVVVIEDFPNTLFTSSPAPLQSFRKTIKYFLALPAPPPDTPPIPPLILIITETASVSGPNSFTAHRLLSPEILHHPLVREINFNKIAPTYMFKALTSIVSQESRQSGRKFGPSKAVLDALSTSGDIRSAIMGLEFLSMNRDLPGHGFVERITQARRRGKPEERELNPSERALVTAVTQRESSYGLFHAVGKVLYNKRYGDDVEDPYVPPQPRPPLSHTPYHPRAVRVDLETLIDETGTDPQTFIAGLHENYLGSCNPGGLARLPSSDEEVIDTVINCIDNLSDADLLCSSFSRSYGYDFADTAGIRADEISFQTAVRGVMLSLPSPVRRFIEPKGGANKMFYPTAARLWKQRQEVAEVLDWFVDKDRAGGGGACRGGKKEALLERMPFLALIERRREWAGRRRGIPALDLQMRKALKRTTAFRGIGRQSEDVVEQETEGQEDTAPMEQTRGRWKKKGWTEDLGAVGAGVGERVEKLVLSDDDIEEF